MNIVIIDGQGGKLGSQIVKALRSEYPYLEIIAIGTNSIATAAMIKSGAQFGATGENPVKVACRTADIIIGPVGIVIADSLLGEITPAMATAVGQSNATRILLPVNRCKNIIAGVADIATGDLIADTVNRVRACINSSDCV